MDCSPPGSSIHGILQERVLEWGAIALSIDLVQLLPNQTWIRSPVSTQANLLTWGCGEGECNIYILSQNKEKVGWDGLELGWGKWKEAIRVHTHTIGFQGKVFKDKMRERRWDV